MSSVGHRAYVEWRYLPGGKVRHALIRANDRSAICGVMPSWFAPDGWHGTGSQVEYETVAQLPECRRCARFLVGEAEANE